MATLLLLYHMTWLQGKELFAASHHNTVVSNLRKRSMQCNLLMRAEVNCLIYGKSSTTRCLRPNEKINGHDYLVYVFACEGEVYDTHNISNSEITSPVRLREKGQIIALFCSHSAITDLVSAVTLHSSRSKRTSNKEQTYRTQTARSTPFTTGMWGKIKRCCARGGKKKTEAESESESESESEIHFRQFRKRSAIVCVTWVKNGFILNGRRLSHKFYQVICLYCKYAREEEMLCSVYLAQAAVAADSAKWPRRPSTKPASAAGS